MLSEKHRELFELRLQELLQMFNATTAVRKVIMLEINELIENVNQKTYAYADVRAQDRLMTITELKSKLKNPEKEVQIVLWIVDSGCSKHMTGDRSLLENFVKKFKGTVCFGNDHFSAITGYGDYVQGNITIAGSYVIIVRVFIESVGMVFEIEEDSGVYIGFNSSSKMKSFILPGTVAGSDLIEGLLTRGSRQQYCPKSVKAARKIYGDSRKLILLAILKMLELNTARMKLFALSEKNVSTVSSIRETVYTASIIR
ncbi:hypothetical protein Tco_1562638 [Tanacetum coccineum]